MFTQHGSNVITVIYLFFLLYSEILWESIFLVQLSSGESVSVTSLFLKERVSNFCFLASGSSLLSFLSWPRSANGESVSVTVLFLSSKVSNFSASVAFPFPFDVAVPPFSSFLSWPRSATGESVSVTVLLRSSRVSNSWAPLVPFSPFFSGFSFASCPRSSFKESVSVTVLFLSSSLSYFSLQPKSAVLLRVSSTSRFLRERVSFSAILLRRLGILVRLVKKGRVMQLRRRPLNSPC